MEFTQFLENSSMVHFEYDSALTPIGLAVGNEHSTEFHIKKTSNGNFVLKVIPECHITSQYNKKGLTIRVVCVFSVTEDSRMALKPSIEICEEVVTKAWEHTKEYVITESAKSYGTVPILLPDNKEINSIARRGLLEMK